MTSEPVRTCIGCRRRRGCSELVRVRADDHDRVVVRPGGRGAWLCLDSLSSCLALATKRRAFGRALRREIVPGPIIGLAPEGSRNCGLTRPDR